MLALPRDYGHIQRFYLKKGTGRSHKASAVERCINEDDVNEIENEYAFPVSGDSQSKEKWIVDSGASSHMTYEKHLLHDYHDFDKPERVRLGGGRTVDAVGTGSICLSMHFKVSDHKQARMHKVLYVPKMACNLFD